MTTKTLNNTYRDVAMTEAEKDLVLAAASMLRDGNADPDGILTAGCVRILTEIANRWLENPATEFVL